MKAISRFDQLTMTLKDVEFPDFKIAAGYSMHADKTRHIIVYGIILFVKDFIIYDAKGKWFTYKFDETTTSKVEN